MTFSLAQFVVAIIVALIAGFEIACVAALYAMERPRSLPPAQSAASRRVLTFTGNENEEPFGSAGDQLVH